MKHIIFFVLLFLSFFNFGQNEMDGVWQGILVQNGKPITQSQPFYLNIQSSGKKITGQTREEVYNTDFYGIGKLYGTIKDSSFEWKHITYQKKVGNSKILWCKLKAKLIYNKKTGYLEGNYSSIDCRNNSGKLVLFRSKAKFSIEESPFVSQNARDILIKDLAEGRPSPEIREIQRLNFKFQPIFFDYDKALIRPTDIPFLNSIVEIVEGHSDLRIKVIGNTDSDGTDEYNDDLSKRRAEAIIAFFVEKGIKRDRIEIQFNGEKKPIDSNKTKEGKQRNRRVEFEFI